MTDLKGIEITDVAGISQPLVKLIDSISSACGKIYEPWHIKRMTEARAEEIKQITASINDNPDLIVKYECGTITVENKSTLERAKQRFINQEIQKQENIDQIVAIAAKELSKETTIIDDPVDKTWMLRFFKSIEDISDEELHILWGKILAGEIKQPNTISLRSLNILKNISKNEAILFNHVSKFALDSTGTLFLPHNNILEKNDIFYSQILKLEEIGLMLSSPSNTLNISTEDEDNMLFRNDNYIAIVKKTQNSQNFPIPVFLFTNSGKEIYSIIKPTNDNSILKDYFQYLLEREKDFNISLHKITSINNDGSIKYLSEPITDIDSI